MLLRSSGSEEETDSGSLIGHGQKLNRKQQVTSGGDVCSLLRSPLLSDRYDSGAVSGGSCPSWLERGLYGVSGDYRPKYENFCWLDNT